MLSVPTLSLRFLVLQHDNFLSHPVRRLLQCNGWTRKMKMMRSFVTKWYRTLRTMVRVTHNVHEPFSSMFTFFAEWVVQTCDSICCRTFIQGLTLQIPGREKPVSIHQQNTLCRPLQEIIQENRRPLAKSAVFTSDASKQLIMSMQYVFMQISRK